MVPVLLHDEEQLAERSLLDQFVLIFEQLEQYALRTADRAVCATLMAWLGR